MIRGENEMLRRIGIYVLSERWDLLKALYLPVVGPDLFNAGHLHELYGLLQKRFESFSDEKRGATIDAIRELLPVEDVDDADRIERLQLRWLSAIGGTTYTPALELFSKLTAKYGGPPRHPDHLSYSEVRSGPGPSHYTAHELVALAESGTIVQHLKAFTPSETWEGPTTDALVDQLQAAVRLSPAVFLRVLPDLITAPIQYQYGVINGFLRLWREPSAEQPYSDWDEAWHRLFAFFGELLGNATFWNEDQGRGQREVTPMWIAASIADLLQAGTRDDARAYPSDLLPTGWSLLMVLLDHSDAVTEPDDDPMTQAINSTRGRALEAVFSHILRSCRLADKESGSHAGVWAQVRGLMDDELEKCVDANFEFSTLAGAYIGNLEYIDKTWLEQNIAKIFPLDRRANFTCAVAGLAYASASRRIYVMLRDAGVIDAALRLDVKGRDAREKLMARVALGYLWGEDSLDSSRFKSRSTPPRPISSRSTSFCGPFAAKD